MHYDLVNRCENGFAQEYAMDVLQGTKVASATGTLQIRRERSEEVPQQGRSFPIIRFQSRIYFFTSMSRYESVAAAEV